ncbi:MAG TPA: ABC transporter substrate-binding protein, partial [Caulobacteraceae bacterium]
MTIGPSRRSALGQLAAGSLAACGAEDDGALHFWAMGREGEVVQTLTPAFERAHPGTRIAVQQLPWTAAHAKLLTAFAGG